MSSQINIDSLDKEKFIKRSTVISALIPSAGQIHNTKIKPDHIRSRLWWKIPVIYGGISTTGYLIYFNQNEFKNISTERLNRKMELPLIVCFLFIFTTQNFTGGI